MRFIKNFVYWYLTELYGLKKKEIIFRANRSGNDVYFRIYINTNGIPKYVSSHFVPLDQLKLIDRDYHTVRRGKTCADKLRYRIVRRILYDLRRNLVSTLTTPYTNLKGE